MCYRYRTVCVHFWWFTVWIRSSICWCDDRNVTNDPLTFLWCFPRRQQTAMINLVDFFSPRGQSTSPRPCRRRLSSILLICNPSVADTDIVIKGSARRGDMKLKTLSCWKLEQLNSERNLRLPQPSVINMPTTDNNNAACHAYKLFKSRSVNNIRKKFWWTHC